MAFDGLKEAGAVISSSKEIGSLFRQGANDARMFMLGQVERIIVNLDSIRDAIDAMDARSELAWRNAQASADGAGLAEVALDGPRSGYIWKITRITCVVNNGVASVGVIYVGSVSPLNARQTLTDADFFSDDIGEIFVPSNNKVIFRVTGAPANEKVSVGVQIEETKVER